MADQVDQKLAFARGESTPPVVDEIDRKLALLRGEQTGPSGLRLERHAEEPAPVTPPTRPIDRTPAPETFAEAIRGPEPALPDVALPLVPSTALRAGLDALGGADPDSFDSQLERAIARGAAKIADPSRGTATEQAVLDIPRLGAGLAAGLITFPPHVTATLGEGLSGRRPLLVGENSAIAEIFGIPGAKEAITQIAQQPLEETARTPFSLVAQALMPVLLAAGVGRMGAKLRGEAVPAGEVTGSQLDAILRKMDAEKAIDLKQLERNVRKAAEVEGLIDHKSELTLDAELMAQAEAAAREAKGVAAEIRAGDISRVSFTGKLILPREGQAPATPMLRVGNRNVTIEDPATVPRGAKSGETVSIPREALNAETLRAVTGEPARPIEPVRSTPDPQPQLLPDAAPTRPVEVTLTDRIKAGGELLRDLLRRPEKGRPPGAGLPGTEVVAPSKKLGWFRAILGTSTNQWKRISAEAGEVATRMALATIKYTRSVRQADFVVDQILDKVRTPLQLRLKTAKQRGLPIPARFTRPRQANRALADVLDGATREAIEARKDLPPNVKEAALELREHLDSFRDLITGTMKDFGFEPPANWGIEGHFPHVFPGQFLVKIKGTPFRQGARTRLEAYSIVKKLAEDSGIDPARLEVTIKQFMPPDVVRLGNRNFHRLVNDLMHSLDERVGGEMKMSQAEIREALSGKIGRRAGKQKFTGFLQRRKGATGSLRDTQAALAAYHRSILRWQHLTDLNRKAQPIIEKMEREGRFALSREMQRNLDRVWGQQVAWSRQLDNTLASIPGVRNIVRPGIADRVLGRTSSLAAMALLKTPRFGFLNSMQPLQTLWPTVTNKEFARGVKMWFTDEGHNLLNKHGIIWDVSRWFDAPDTVGGFGATPTATSNRIGRLRRFSPLPAISEARNQGIAWLTLFDKYKSAGMAETAAADLATARGQIYTQFLGAVSDHPGFVRGPATRVMFQFRRFQIKNLELAVDMLQDRNYPGVMKWLVANVAVGGIRQFTRYSMVLPGINRAFPADMPAEVYKSLEENLGENAANVITFGVPALAGADFSYSVQLIDMPFAENTREAVGELFLGPAANLALQVGGAAQSVEGPLPRSGPGRAFDVLMRRVPTMRWMEAGWKIGKKIYLGEDGGYDFRTPGGRLQYKTDLTGMLAHAAGFRTMDQAKQDLVVDAFTRVMAERDKHVSRAAQRLAAATSELDPEKAQKEYDKFDRIVADWNDLFGDMAPIQPVEAATRMRSRLKHADLDTLERYIQNAPKAMRLYGIELQEDLLREQLITSEETRSGASVP